MIFDAHTDVLFDVINNHHTFTYHLKEMNGYQGAILNYYFKGNESYSSFLFVLDKIKKFYEDNKNLLERKNMLLGIEGLGAVKSVQDLKSLIETGIKSVTLTWNDNNKFAMGTYCGNQSGLTSEGKKVLDYLFDKQILVDLSHLSEKSFWDVINYYQGAMIVSHSNVKKLQNDERNLSDEQLRIIKDKNILVGVNSYAKFVGQKENLESLVNIIDYLKEKIGINLICLGLDFDYYLNSTKTSGAIEGLKSSADLDKLKNLLKIHGYKEYEIRKIFYGNILYFLKKTKILC